MAKFPVEGDPPSVDLGGADAAAGIGSAGPSNVQADLNARPTSAALASESGASSVGLFVNSYSVATTVQARMDRLGGFLPEGGYVASTDATRFLHSLYALGASDERRTIPPRYPSFGFGRLNVPKGKFHADTGFGYNEAPLVGSPAPVLGLDIVGHNSHSSVLTTDSPSARGLDFQTYVGVKVADLALINKHNNGVPSLGDPNADPPVPADTSAGIYLDSEGGGGLLQIDGVVIDGFHTCIKQAPSNTGDGDKTMVSNCSLVGAQHIYDQGVNKQAIGWTFLNNNFGSNLSTYKLGGAGELLLINNIGNLYSSFLEFPEGTGNGGNFSRATHFIGQRVTVMSQKMEFTSSNVKIIDASACLRKVADHATATPAGAADIRFRDVSVTNAVGFVDENTNIIIKVGDLTQGSDNFRVNMEGGNIPGGIEIGSNKTYLHGHDTVTWSFSRMLLAPRPDLISFLGEGQHPLLEYRANENVKIDQYRGGQAGNVSIDARKSYLCPTQGKYLIDTRASGYDSNLDGRVGKNFTIPLPQTGRNANYMGGIGNATVAQLALAVYMENPTLTENASAVVVQQFADASFSTPLTPAVEVPANHKGLFFIHQFSPQPNNISNGEIYVRITKANAGEWSEGVLVFDYYPYLGA